MVNAWYPNIHVCPIHLPLHTLITSTTVIEAEVYYALRHEYALSAIDILARRMRLSFLNARAALDALPRVIDIMSSELNWSRNERKKQIRDAVEFLVGSMGLDEGYVSGDFVRRTRERMQPRGRIERLERGWWYIHGLINRSLGNIVGVIDSRRSVSTSVITAGEKIRVLGRARFEAGEVGALRSVFDKYATSSVLSAPSSSQREDKNQILTASVINSIKEVAGYEAITRKELEYVLEEAGFSNQEALDWEEFLEVCGGLREVSISPAEVTGTYSLKARERRVIPVEKSGGGV